VLNPPSDVDLVRSLRSNTCPCCGKRKVIGQTFARACYITLPQQTRSDLYSPLGEGYAEAVTLAMRQRGASTMRLPPAAVAQAYRDTQSPPVDRPRSVELFA
jgi:hypothetical protein